MAAISSLLLRPFTEPTDRSLVVLTDGLYQLTVTDNEGAASIDGSDLFPSQTDNSPSCLRPFTDIDR